LIKSQMRISSAVPRLSLRILAVCTASLLIGSPVARSEEFVRDSGPKLDVVDLVINWSSFQHKVVSVAGRVRCENEDYCWLQGVPELSRVASMDISSLPPADKRHLVLGCHVQPCEILFQGEVHDDDISALLIDKFD